MTYIDCMIAAVPKANKQAYIDHARKAGEIFKQHGALKLVENWGDDIPDGEITSLPKAVKCRSDETVVVSWIVWPSKDTRNQGMQGVMDDPEMAANPMPFDGQRLIYGGFEQILDL